MSKLKELSVKSPRSIVLLTFIAFLIPFGFGAWGCQQAKRTMILPAHPVADGLPKGRTRGTVELPTIDLGDGYAKTSVVPTIIDTRTFNATNGQAPPWRGDTRRPGKVLPAHKRDKSLPQDPPNRLEAGGLLRQSRVDAGPLFPAIYQTPWTPPDPNIAVGPEHVVVTVNMAIAFYDRDGNEQFIANLDETGDPGFFEDVGAGGFTFDPKCFYDASIDRFVVLALEVYQDQNEGWMTIAISDDSDPNGIWYKYRTWSVITVDGNEYWPDYPGFGFDSNSFYVTCNLFGFSGGFAGAIYRRYPKAPMSSGNPIVFQDFLDGSSASVQVAQCLDPRSAPLFVSRAGSSRLKIQSLTTDTIPPQLVTSEVDVPNAENPNQDAPNLGGGNLSTLDGRIMNVTWNDSGLWTAHAVRGTNNNTKSRWYHIDTNNFPSGTPVLAESGDVDLGSDVFTFFPAIAVNRYGDAAMVFAKSLASEYASIQATARRSGDPAGTMGVPVQLAQGNAGTEGRWGDYFDIAVDPLDNSTFWIVGEYVQEFSNGDKGWQTWVGTIEVSCPGDITGDNVVNVDDLLTVLAGYNQLDSDSDVNGDGVTNVNDILIVIASWGSCPGTP
ncbi:MAG: dockerin type I repeat-containing protein [Phycisphaerales bacterium]|nr:dockerin type I repeat-containing protein [Phycisphaerales bacterium]